MYKNILVAVDGSPVADRALDQAIELAKDHVTLRVIHVVDMGVLPLAPELAIDMDALTRARRAAGDKILEVARKAVSDAGLKAESQRLETGTPTQPVAAVIAAEAERWSADLIVLGTHGQRGFVHHLLGSVADGVVRRARMPVLMVPPPAPAEG
jgi:nucleotide-binding universal stress UspA family protein